MQTFLVMVRAPEPGGEPHNQVFAARFPTREQAADAVLTAVRGAALLGVAMILRQSQTYFDLADGEVRAF